MIQIVIDLFLVMLIALELCCIEWLIFQCIHMVLTFGIYVKDAIKKKRGKKVGFNV